MKWLDPNTHPIPENIPCIIYRIPNDIDDDPVIVVKSTTFDKNQYTNLTYEGCLEHVNIKEIKAWMFLPLAPESHDQYLEEKQKELEDTILQSIAYPSCELPNLSD